MPSFRITPKLPKLHERRVTPAQYLALVTHLYECRTEEALDVLRRLGYQFTQGLPDHWDDDVLNVDSFYALGDVTGTPFCEPQPPPRYHIGTVTRLHFPLMATYGLHHQFVPEGNPLGVLANVLLRLPTGSPGTHLDAERALLVFYGDRYEDTYGLRRYMLQRHRHAAIALNWQRNGVDAYLRKHANGKTSGVELIVRGKATDVANQLRALAPDYAVRGEEHKAVDMSVPGNPVFYDEFGHIDFNYSYPYPLQVSPTFSSEIYTHYRKEKLRLLTE